MIVIVAVFFIPPALFAVAVYHVWRNEGTLRPHARTIVAAGLLRLAMLLIGVAVLPTALGGTSPNALFIFIILLYLASIGIRVVGVVNRVLVLLVGVYVLLGISHSTVPVALAIVIGLLALASSVIGVRNAIQDARSGKPRPSQE